MATHARTIHATRRPFVIPLWRLNVFWRMRKDLLFGRLILALGFFIPLLMIAGVLEVSLWLGFFALGLIGVGGLILLICCGEIA